MLFNFTLNGKTYEMDLSPEMRVEIVRHLLKLHKEYLAANPTENIDFEQYLALVEKSPHPENVPTEQEQDDDDEGTIEDDLIAYGAQQEATRRKDLLIEGLIELIGKLR